VVDVEYPEMRVEVLRAIKALADPEYQWRVWVRHELPHPDYYDEFKLEINILYDDTRLLELLDEAVIGDILRDEREREALRPCQVAMDNLFDKYGTKLTDEQYLVTPEWRAVVAAAQAALGVLEAPSEE
jgi:hypothetical protein